VLIAFVAIIAKNNWLINIKFNVPKLRNNKAIPPKSNPVLNTLNIKYLIAASLENGPKLQCNAKIEYRHMPKPTKQI